MRVIPCGGQLLKLFRLNVGEFLEGDNVRGLGSDPLFSLGLCFAFGEDIPDVVGHHTEGFRVGISGSGLGVCEQGSGKKEGEDSGRHDVDD